MNPYSEHLKRGATARAMMQAGSPHVPHRASERAWRTKANRTARKAQAAMLSPLGVLHGPRGTCRKARRRSVRLHEVRRMARALPYTPPCSYFVAAHGIDVSSDGRDSSASRGHAARRPGGATEYAASVLRPCAAAATHAFNGSARPLLYDRPKHRRPKPIQCDLRVTYFREHSRIKPHHIPRRAKIGERGAWT